MSDIDPVPNEEPEVKPTPQEQYLLAIAEEIEKDPTGRGYAGKSDEEQAALLNEPWYEYVPVQMTPRIAVVIASIPFTPNAVKVEEVTDAKVAKASADAKATQP